MPIIIDLIILGIILLCLGLGFKRGLTGSILKILSFIIAIVISAILFKPVSNFIVKNTLIDDKIEEAILSIVEDEVQETGKVEDGTNLPDAMINYINESIQNAANDAKTTIVKSTAHNITLTIVNAGSAILLFIIARIALIFVKALTNLITELPIIKQFDKLGGIIYGLLEGLIIVFIILAIISFISPLIEQTGIIIALNKSVLGSILYNNNLLLKIIF